MIYKFKWLILFAFITGLIILLLPDKSKPLIEFNRSHGPSTIDLVGLILIFASWIVCSIDVIKSWDQLAIKPGNQTLIVLALIYAISIAGIIIGLNLSMDIILWIGVTIASIINIVLIIFTYRIVANNS